MENFIFSLEAFNGRFVLFCMVKTIIMVPGIWLLAAVLIRDKSLVGAFMQGAGKRRRFRHCLCGKYLRELRHGPSHDRVRCSLL